MSVAIVKYCAGNIHSVLHALNRLGVEGHLTDREDELMAASKVIFPGVGEAGTTMKYLRDTGLDRIITSLTQPVLGICLGQQLMCATSEEGGAECLGIFDVPVWKFRPSKRQDKVPHVGWNTITSCKDALYKGFTEEEFVYFVHSFYVPVCQWTIAVTDYITPFSASLHKDNFWATQFHPEKSGSTGEKILKNFLEL